MSTRYNNGSQYENHQRVAELHDKGAHAHLSAAETHEKQDHESGQELSRQALEHSRLAYQNAEQARQDGLNEHGFAIFGHDEIAALDYKLWQLNGCREDSAKEDWSNAAQQLRDRKESLQK